MENIPSKKKMENIQIKYKLISKRLIKKKKVIEMIQINFNNIFFIYFVMFKLFCLI